MNASARDWLKKGLDSLGLLESTRQIMKRWHGAVNRAADSLRNPVHVAKERLWRLPNPLIKMRLEATIPPGMRPVVETLRRDGIVILRNHVQGNRLRQLQEGFNRMIEAIKAAPPSPEEPAPPPWTHHLYREQGYDSELESTYTYDPFKHDVNLLEIALDEFVLSAVARYFGKRFMVQQAIASRYYPMPPRDFGSWQWHHDAWGKRINVMFLLTDVMECDQYMSYMKGSHHLIHSYNRYLNSRFTDAEANSYPGLERLDCVGSAGTVLIFDPNGFHRGNRSLGAYRDSLITSYSCGRYIWKFNIPHKFVEILNEGQQTVLRNNPRINYV